MPKSRPAVECGVDQPGGGASRLTAFLTGACPVGRVSLIYYRLVFLQRLDAFNPAAVSWLQRLPVSGPHRQSSTERSSRSIAHYISVNYWTSAAVPPSQNGRTTRSRRQTGLYHVALHQIHSRRYAACCIDNQRLHLTCIFQLLTCCPVAYLMLTFL